MDRRMFVKHGGTALAAGMLPLHRLARLDRIEKIGVQLYTVRDLMKVSVERTLAQIAAIGYKEVEFAPTPGGYYNRPPRAIKQLLDDNGMSAPSAHIGIEALRGPWNRTLADAAEVGHKWLVLASINDNDRNSVDAIKRTADLIHKAAEDAKFYKIKLAYHNHVEEFKEVDGKAMLDQLLDLTKADELQLEMDLYWITRAGADPLKYFSRYPGRIPLVHLKDGGPPPDYKMSDVGKGVIDWKGLLSHHKEAGIKHYFVEHDSPENPMASLKDSFEYLKKLEF